MLKNFNRIVFLAPLSSISRRPRLFKIVNYVNDKYPNINIAHWGWERNKGERDEQYLEFDIQKQILLEGGSYGGSKVKLMYLLWMFKCFMSCLKLKKEDVVWALGFESAFPALLASKFKGYSIIFDDADRFSLVFNFPRVINRFINKMEFITSKNVNFHIVPGLERYNFYSEKFFILKNMPSKIELAKAKDIFYTKVWPTASIVFNVNGLLQDNRGLDIILDLCKRLENESVHFIVAGRLASINAEQLVGNKNVTYLGSISNAEALASYYASDFVFTYFKPDTEINTLAESNKWGDAIKCGVGIIVNKEVKTADYIRKGGACISFDYYDINALEKEIRMLLNRKDLLTAYKDNSSKLSDKYKFFEDQLNDLLELKY